MVSGVDTLTAPLHPTTSLNHSSDAAYVQFPAGDATTTSTVPSTSSSSPLLAKLRQHWRWVAGASLVAVILLIAAAVILSRDTAHHTGSGAPITPGTNPSIPTAASNSSCPQTVIETEGPYWIDERLNRSDLASTSNGLNLALELLVYNSTVLNKCVPVVGAMVDVWHADALGLYSDEQILGTKGKTFLRGYQMTNADGLVNFLTAYPGWYQGRTIHIHVRVRVYDADGKIIHNQTTQLFMSDDVNDAVMAVLPYSDKKGKRDTYNNKDNLYHSSLLVNVTGDTKTGYSGSFAFGVPFVR